MRINTIVPNYPRAYTQEVEQAIADARIKADETDSTQVVFEGSAYDWYGYMSLKQWQSVDDDELCRIQVVKPREVEEAKKKELIKKLDGLSMEQLQKLEEFLTTI